MISRIKGQLEMAGKVCGTKSLFRRGHGKLIYHREHFSEKDVFTLNRTNSDQVIRSFSGYFINNILVIHFLKYTHETITKLINWQDRYIFFWTYPLVPLDWKRV